MIDREVFEEHFRKYFEPLTRYAYLYVKDREQSKEIVQNVFVSLWEKRISLKITSGLTVYLFQTVKNKSLNYLRDSKKVSFVTEFPEKVVQDEEIVQLHSLQEIHRHVNNLPARCREVFILKRIHGLSYKQIGMQMNISEKSVENQMTIAFKKLRKAMVNGKSELKNHL